MKTAMQELIAWGDDMLLNHPKEHLSFGDAIDKTVSLLGKEKEQIINAHIEGWSDAYDYLADTSNNQARQAEDYYNQTYQSNKD
jgi:hypothetical protein